jgi:Tol biopolymer transport system component
VTSSPAPTAATSQGRLLFSLFNEISGSWMGMHSIRPDGSDEVTIPLPGPEGGGRWSRSGREIAVMTIRPDGRGGTAVLMPDGTVDRILDIPGRDLNLLCSVWSADDRRLACYGWDDTDDAAGGLYTVSSADGDGPRQLTHSPEGTEDLLGDFSPDGQLFVFKRGPAERNGQLMVVDVNGGEPRAISDALFEDGGRFSPDGRLIASSVSGHLVIVDLQGAIVHQVIEPDAYLFGPSWSPDGEWIAYSRAVGGPFADVYISRPDGSNRWQVTRTSANEVAVDWGRAGD